MKNGINFGKAGTYCFVDGERDSRRSVVAAN